MVPCQPRQLVIFSLPFAALVAFFWYKRRKSLSRSDPGGTADLRKPVDNKAKTNSSTEESENCDNKDFCSSSEVSPSKSEPVLLSVSEKALDEPNAITFDEEKRTKPVIEPSITAENKNTQESIPVCNKDRIICNVLIDHIKDNSEVINNLNDKNSGTLDCETASIFNSTIIDDIRDVDESEESFVVKDQTKEVTLGEISPQKDSICDNKDSDNTLTENCLVEVQNIPLELQNTLENIASKLTSVVDEVLEKSEGKKKIVVEKVDEKCEIDRETPEKLSKSVPLEVNSNRNKKGASSTSSENISSLTLSTENISTDTGLGSQELTPIKDMAQGHDTEDKNDSCATGLESKLASLGLDTQPSRQAERDSANHSPAEVMLNSPAISTFSDAHSEGSSDSGKGCSEVVTPPSRTPAGGSSVAGDQLPSVYEFVLPQVIVGRLIGRHGLFLHDIRAKTHTNVFIKRHPETTTLKICAIEGTQQDIDAALKMIRQKFPLRRFPELTLERVSFVKTPSMPISPENMYLHLVEGVNNDVVISSLISAGHFFLQMPMHLSYQCLYRLACVMNTVYSAGDNPALPDPQPGMVCVAPSTGGWYRALILSVDEEAHTSDIKFLDYGGFLTVDNSMLRQIRIDFLQLPFQAVECALANVVPAGGEEDWSEEATQLVQQMTLNQMLQAVVYHYTEDGLPCVGLYCTQYFQSATDPTSIETKVVLINQELVARGFAELVNATEEE